MTSVKVNVASLLQGMSQRDSRLRRDTEAELQLNCVSDTTYGLGTRPGTQHVAVLGGLVSTVTLWDHWIKRDEQERYVVIFDGQRLKVFNFATNTFEVVQADASALAYLVNTNPNANLFGLTVLDTTYIVNRTKVTAMDSYAVPTPTPKALVWVRAGNYKTEYIVTVDGVDAKVETLGSGGGDPAADSIQTNQIATDLETALGDPAFSSFTITRDENVLTIEKTDGSDFDITVNDSVADSQLGLTKGNVARFNLLPPRAPDGYVVQVVGLDSAGEDDYWVKFISDSPGELSDGRWEETAAPGTTTRFDASTMPHKLSRLQDDSSGTETGVPFQVYFKLEPVDWLDAIAGDDETNPPPSFIGRTIDSLFLLSGRLGFLSGSQVVLSQTGDFVQLRRTTMQVLSPDDRIDASAGDGKVVNLRYAVPLSEQLLLAGDDAVMAIPTDSPVEPGSFRFTTSLQTRLDDRVAPLPVGGSLFLPVRNGVFSDIREAVSSGVERIKSSSLATGAVPSLIQGSVTRWDADDTGSTLFIKASGARRRLYIYRWIDGDNERVQSSWGFWRFEDPVISIKVIDKQLWLLMARPEGLVLEVMDLDAGQPQTGQLVPFRLDRYAVLTTPASESVSDPDDGPDDPDDGPDDDGSTSGGPSAGDGGTGVGGPGDADGIGLGFGSGPTGLGFGETTPEGGGVQQLNTPSGPESAYTTLELPYNPWDGMCLVDAITGEELTWSSTDEARTIMVVGDVGTRPLLSGQKIDARYSFGQVHARQATAAGNRMTMTGNRLQVMRLNVECSNAGTFYADLYEKSTYLGSEMFNPLDFDGDPGAFPRASGTFSIPVRMNAEQARVGLRFTSYLPVWVIKAQWEAQLMTYGSQL